MYRLVNLNVRDLLNNNLCVAKTGCNEVSLLELRNRLGIELGFELF